MSNTHRRSNPGFRSSRLSQTIQGILLASALTASVAAHGEEATNRKSYQISGGSLGQALSQFARDAGILFTGESTLTDGKTSKGLEGEYTVEEGFRKLLSGSGLTYTIADDNAVAIKVAEPGSDAASTLPAVKVLGKAVYDSTDPYNTDYNLPNASTGTKTDTPLMKTPVNIQVIPKAVLNDQQVITFDQALKNVAGVITGGNRSTGGFGSSDDITLRGFQSSVQFRDGFRIDTESNAVGSRQMTNVERIEVLKGPAAMMYGRGEPGGMVNVITKQPLASPYYALQQQFGSFDFYRTSIDATGPLTKDDTLLYRTNISYEDSGSFRELVDNKRFFIAPVLKWNISPRTQATLEMEYNHDRLNFDYQALPFLNGKFVDIPRSRNLNERSLKQVDTIFLGFNWSHAFNDNWTISHRFSTRRVDQEPSPTSDSGFAGGVTGTTLGRSVFTFDKQTEDYYTTMDLTGKFETGLFKHTLLFGGDYYRHDISSIYTDPFGTLPSIDIFNPIHNDTITINPNPSPSFTKTNTDNYGLYLQDQIELADNIYVMGGIRYQNVQTLNKIKNTSTADDAVTPRVGILWQPQSWLSVYGNYVENFGAANAQGFDGNQLPPQSAQQYEGGIKTEFFNGRLNATLAYFDLTKQNVATTDPNHPRFSIATGEVRSRGPELDIRGEILPGWNAIATYANLDTHVTKSNSGDVGYRLFGVPRNMGSLWNTYDFQQDALKGLKIGGGITLRDSTVGFNNKQTTTGYATVDLLAAYSMKVGKSKVTAQLNRVVFLNYALFDTLKFHNPAANKINISLTNEI